MTSYKIHTLTLNYSLNHVQWSRTIITSIAAVTFWDEHSPRTSEMLVQLLANMTSASLDIFPLFLTFAIMMVSMMNSSKYLVGYDFIFSFQACLIFLRSLYSLFFSKCVVFFVLVFHSYVERRFVYQNRSFKSHQFLVTRGSQ